MCVSVGASGVSWAATIPRGPVLNRRTLKENPMPRLSRLLPKLFIAGCSVLNLWACGAGSSSDTAEVANATGDVMASVDESGTGGQFASLDRPMLQRRDFLAPGTGTRILDALVPAAYADACATDAFS